MTDGPIGTPSLTLVIGNKAYSSWSLRPWLAMTHFGIGFQEIVVPLRTPESRAALLRYSPSGRAPVLIMGGVAIWDSLAIIEFLAETFPEHAIWPREKNARAVARALAAEMHSSYQALRGLCPTNFRLDSKPAQFTEDARADIARIEQAWAEARARYGADGPFLFGSFSAADAMFAPVVNRFAIYNAPVSAQTRAYMAAVQALPAWRQWREGAMAESWRIAQFEDS